MVRKSRIENASVRTTEWIGTTDSLVAHTIVFIACFFFVLAGAPLNTVLLILTTAVSLEAIYLAIFIQMTVNRNTRSLEEVEEDIEEIQEDVKEIETDVDEISEDVEEISGDIDKIQEKDEQETVMETGTRKAIEKIERDLGILLRDIETLKQSRHSPAPGVDKNSASA
jgi:peptidoglycan hydrolase CwlO-like protein